MRQLHVMMLASGKSYHATRWANALHDRGLAVTFVTVHPVVRPLVSSINVIELPSVGKLSYALTADRLRRLVKKLRPDLVHSHSAGGYALMGRLSGGRPWILSVYGADVYDVPTRSFIHKTIVGHMLASADQVLSTSHAMVKQVSSLYPSLPPPIVTPFGVDTKLFAPTPRRAGGQAVIKIGMVKKLDPKYGVDILLQAFELVAGRYGSSVELHIVGEGSERTRLLAMRDESKWSDQIHFHGPVPNTEVPVFLNDWDIFVVPSRFESESFGVAAVEASAAGLPVIVSDVGGLPEVVDHERTGLVVRREDPTALADAIARLIDNPEERQRLGSAGRGKVEEMYDWRKNVEQMIQIYEDVLARVVN